MSQPPEVAPDPRARLQQRLLGLADLIGPCGHEEAVRAAIEEQIRPFVGELEVDGLGNLIARRRPRGGAGRGLRVMVAAHMDEIGLMVTHVEESGFLRVEPVGEISPAVALGQRVAFGSGAAGVVGSEPVEEGKELRWERLFVDIGAGSAEQALGRVQPGDVAAFARKARVVADHRITGKALDGRCGCAVLLEALARLGDSPHELFFAFTVQEEVGTRGARPAAFRVEPEVALAVDVTPAADTPGSRPLPVALGRGAAIKVKDETVIAHPGLRRLLVERARQQGIPYQLDVTDQGGTDAGAIQRSRQGVISGGLSVPIRYLHTPAEMVDLADAEAAVQLLVALLEGPMAL